MDEQQDSSDVHDDRHDFGRLFVKFQPRIYGFIRSLVFNRDDAEEILQETASVLWRKFDEFERGSNFLAWALTVARYQLMYFQQQRKRQVMALNIDLVEAIEQITVEQGDRITNMHESLTVCLDRLEPEDRELFCSRYTSEQSVRELAGNLGRPTSTIYNTLSRIRRNLLECVERQQAEEDRL